MRYITVRTAKNGAPLGGARVAVYVHQFLAQGMKDAEYTNGQGEARIGLDVDTHAEISIYVDGSERVPRGSIESEYVINV
ncbi:MAG: hypothetical protein LC772_12310 [Chloroflexi bacterium]|nr:hypothetical protein [Chloroflexota bacterium]